MSGGNLNKEIFLNTVKSDASNGTSNAKAMLKRSCPELSDAHCEDIVASILGAMTMSDSDKVSLVVTAPPSFTIKARTPAETEQPMQEPQPLSSTISVRSWTSRLWYMVIQPVTAQVLTCTPMLSLRALTVMINTV